ncbi:ABC transporter permease [Sphingomonas montanisoli]|uniref:FtsX-like permease family protein n=1 Tax=Sphingomonas montanisoli TaxID=2606412 RepID=A0A5D9CAH8_9SPHN|nr:ABC transporter permease [Sphingomonas montanisoli]TZG28784.1 FtsX-like permease family protein [Sphingomonas montanisoli]
MWRNYLTVGIRALAKNRAYAFINILGLAIGMAACLMILLFVRYELTYDATLPGVEKAYQFQSHYKSSQTGAEMNLQMSSYIAGQRFQKDFPQVDKLVYALGGSPVVMKDGEATPTEDVLLVDGNFFDVLRFPFLRGNPATALSNAGSIVLTESEARKYFGSIDVLGKTLTLTARAGRTIDYRITGVTADTPKNSAIKYTMIGRVDMASYWADIPEFLDSWGWQSGWVFLTLRPGADPKVMEAQLPAWEKRNIPNETLGGLTTNQGDDQDWHIVNIRDVHLGKAQAGSMTNGNDRGTVITFGVIALLILGMACVNFTNLATARAGQRAREVALRKVLGASRQQLIAQFLAESILMSGIAMLVALAIVEISLPWFSSFLKANIQLQYWGLDGVILPMILLVLVVGLAGGLYPAFILSGFQPARVLKANKSSADAQGSGRLRSILVVGQFAVSIGLIICTAIIYGQTIYAQTSDPGFRRDGILQIPNVGRIRDHGARRALVDEIKRIDGVVAAATTSIGVNTRNSSNRGFQIDGRNDPIELGTYAIDPDFFAAMGMQRVAGRNLDRNRPMDDATLPFPSQPAADAALNQRGLNVVMNELAVKRLGFSDPQAAIGKTVRTSMVDLKYGPTPVTIVGVFNDTRFRSVRTPMEPMMFYRDQGGDDYVVVRYSGDPQAVNNRIEQLWKRRAATVPYQARFSEEIVGKLYEAETARAQIFASFAILAVIVGCLGLFGLASFTAERRTKEIGIRKVLGARTRDIVQLLVWQFSRPVLIANLIAWPIAWWVMRDWLNTFDSRITLTPVPFVIAGAIALVIAIGTISAHAVRVARANPIHALRYE